MQGPRGAAREFRRGARRKRERSGRSGCTIVDVVDALDNAACGEEETTERELLHRVRIGSWGIEHLAHSCAIMKGGRCCVKLIHF